MGRKTMVSRTDTQDMHVTFGNILPLWSQLGPGLIESWGVSLLTNAYRNVTITIELKDNRVIRLFPSGLSYRIPPGRPHFKREG